MIKFGSLDIKDIRIGEQQVKKVAVGSEIVWERKTETLVYGWDNSMGLPDSNLWELVASGTTPPSMVDGFLRIHVPSTGGGNHAGLRYKDVTVRDGDNRMLIVKLKPVASYGNGIRVILSDGLYGNTGLQININGGYLNVLTGNNSTGTINRTATITYNDWHEIKLILRRTDISQVYLDGTLIAEQTNAQLSQQYAQNTWMLTQQGTCDVESFKVYDI